MAAYVVALIGLGGAIVGGLLTSISQFIVARRAQEADLLQWLRDNRRNTYAEFLTACNRATLLGRQSALALRTGGTPVEIAAVYAELQSASAAQGVISILGGTDCVAASRDLLEKVFKFTQRALVDPTARLDYASAAGALVSAARAELNLPSSGESDALLEIPISQEVGGSVPPIVPPSYGYQGTPYVPPTYKDEDYDFIAPTVAPPSPLPPMHPPPVAPPVSPPEAKESDS